MSADRRGVAAVAVLAAVYFALLWVPSFSGQYRYFIDELYYLACADHLAFGYVDHPPLSIALLAGVRAVASDALPVLRIVPSACGAATVLLTGLMARRLGADAWGQSIAALAAMAGAIYMVMFGFYSMNALATTLWAATFLVLIDIERLGEPRLWLMVGLLAGLALENKHTFVLLGGGLAVGMLLTSARRHLASLWLWGGVGVAAALALPNVLWQIANGFPSLEFYRNADLLKNVPTPPLDALMQQVLYMNPVAAIVWVAGAVFFLGTERGRPWRHLGILFAALFLMMVFSQKSRPDRIANAYTIAFAGGGVLLGELTQQGRRRWLRWALPVLIIGAGGLFAPIGLPLASPATTAAYGQALGVVPQIEQGDGKATALPQWLADRRGWAQLADDVASAVARLSVEERRTAVIVAPSYGQAGAVELFGRGRDLPPVYGTQNSYWHWGPPPDSVSAAIFVGPFGRDVVELLFEEVELAGRHDCDYCMPWRDDQPIWIGRRPRASFAQVWPRLRHYE